ncbi:MAG: helicase-related protein [Candidatus Poribacteria bacterium]
MGQNYSSVALYRLLKNHFGRDEFLSGQEEAITNILSGNDVLAIFTRDNDRSISYDLPALVFDGITMIVSRHIDNPDIDLLPSTYISNSLGSEILQKRIHDIVNGKYKLIYISPEQFQNRAFLFAMKKIPLSLLVINDADRMSRYGYDFSPNYQRIYKVISDLDSQPRILAFIGAGTEKTQLDIIKILHTDSMKIITPDLSYPNVSLDVIPATSEKEKLDKLGALIPELNGRGIIFVNTQNTATNVFNYLKNIEPNISVYHGGTSREKRNEIERDFESRKLKIIVATSFSNIKLGTPVDYVIHLDMPDRLDRYFDHISLAGQSARCVLIYSPSDKSFHHSMIEANSTSRTDIWRISDMLKRHDKSIVEKEKRSPKKIKSEAKPPDIDDWLNEHFKRLSRSSRKELLKLRDIYENLIEIDKNPFSLNEYNQYLESEHWREFAKHILDENKQCGICENRAEHVHHLHYRNIRKENAEDVVVLCVKCHCFIHPDNPMTEKVFDDIREADQNQLKLIDTENRRIIVIPYEQIESETALNISKFQNAISEMQSSGMIEILPDYSINAKVKIIKAKNQLMACSENNVGRSLVEWLFRESESDPAGDMNINLLSLSSELNCSNEVLEYSFLTLDFAGCISFRTMRKGVALRLIDLDVSMSDEVFEKQKGIKYDSIRLMEDYITTKECRWKFLFNHLLGDIDEKCGKCDNCLSDQKIIPAEIEKMSIYDDINEGDIAIIAILNCAEKTDGLIGRKDMAKLLIGQRAKRIQRYGFDHIEEFSCLSKMDKNDIIKCIDGLIEKGCLQVSSLFFPMIQLTDVGRRRLAKQ